MVPTCGYQKNIMFVSQLKNTPKKYNNVENRYNKKK